MREPEQLRAILRRLLERGSPAHAALEAAAAAFAAAPVRWIAGMGSSWHAGFAIQHFCDASALSVRNLDAGELVHFARIPRGAVILALSRSGKSVEVVDLLPKARAAGATVIAVTNDPESPLARGADHSIALGAPFDFNVSVTMYSGVALAGALIVAMATGRSNGVESDVESREIDDQLAEAGQRLPTWQRALEQDASFDVGAIAAAPTILLARGPGLAAAYEARQLFEEAAKLPATAHSTGAFRHGPNEVVRPGVHVILWFAEAGPTRALDLSLAADLRRAGARTTLVGRDLAVRATELGFDLPRAPARWQFLVELMPVRLLIERIARARGVDCDVFRFCPYVVDREGGLGGGEGPRRAQGDD